MFERLPEDLPEPQDDGAASHLPGCAVPAVGLCSTSGRTLRLDALGAQRTVVFCYPRTGRPDEPLPEGWRDIPGAFGCSAEACSFRDRHERFSGLDAAVFGLSTQTTEYQQEMVGRLRLPFEVLSDADLRFSSALRLPTLTVGGAILLKRLTLVLSAGTIEHVFYPVFPPDEHAEQVRAWLARRRGA